MAEEKNGLALLKKKRNGSLWITKEKNTGVMLTKRKRHQGLDHKGKMSTIADVEGEGKGLIKILGGSQCRSQKKEERVISRWVESS